MSEQIENIKNELVEKSANIAAEKASETANAALETKTAEINETLATKASAEDVAKLAKSIDEVKEMTKNFNIGAPKRDTRGEIMAAIKGGVQDLKAKGSGEFNINTKDFTISAGTASNAYGEAMDGTTYYDPNHQTRMRNFVPNYGVGEGQGAVRWNLESALTDDAGPKTKGSVGGDGSGQSNVQTLQSQITPLATLQASLTVPEEHLSDIPGIDSYINNRLIGLLMDVEDTQILTGAGGNTPQMSGINIGAPAASRLTTSTLADAFFTDNVTDSQVTRANNYDVFSAVAAELEADNFRPDTVILNPIDYRALSWIKSSQGEYVLTQAMENDTPVTYFGSLRIVPNAGQAANTFTIFDSFAVGYWLKGGVEFKFGYHTDDFLSNNITARAIIRGAQTSFRPNGIVTGSLSICRTSIGV